MLKKREEPESLAHTRWNCKYHIVFAPKYRRQVIHGQIKADIGSIIRKLCEYKGVEILEAEACPDHIHMLVSIPPKYSVSQFMGYLKGKSSLFIKRKEQTALSCLFFSFTVLPPVRCGNSIPCRPFRCCHRR